MIQTVQFPSQETSIGRHPWRTYTVSTPFLLAFWISEQSPGLPGITETVSKKLLTVHWLDVPERVQYKLGVLMYRCQHNQAPRYLTDHCTPISDTVFRQRLRSASSHQVSIPHYRLSTRRVRPSGFFCCWSDGLELTARRHAGSGVFCGQLQPDTEDIFIFAVKYFRRFAFFAVFYD